MKKLLLSSLFGAAVVAGYATSYTYAPTPNDLGDLAHNSAYTWGITDAGLASQLASGGYRIASATLTIRNLYNWDKSDTDNQLFIHLLDNPVTGVGTVIDDPNDNGINQGVVSDYFAGKVSGNYVNGKWVAYGYADTSTGAALATGGTNTYLTQYHDTDGPMSLLSLWTYNFSASNLSTLTSYIADGHNGGSGFADFGIGFDPDCHFYNDGITLNITTVRVPEGGMTLIMIGCGLVALVCYYKFSRRKKVD